MKPPFSLYLALLLLAIGLPTGLATGEASAQTQLTTLGKGSVKEVSHQRSIDLTSHLIRVDERIILANTSKLDAEAIYEFDLPALAAISGLKIRNSDGLQTTYGVVDSVAGTRLVAEDAPGAVADVGILRMVASEGEEPGDRKRYELRVYPVPAKRTSTVEFVWQSPTRYEGGTLGVRLPARGDGPGLARSEVIVVPKLSLQRLFGGGKVLAQSTRAGKSHRFFAPVAGELVIQGRPSPIQKDTAEVAFFPLSESTGVAAVRLMIPEAPRSPAPALERALVIVDVSKSLGDEGRLAASRLVESLLGELGTGTRVEAILFDRKAERVLGKWQPAERTQRASIVRAIRTAKGDNGSNLQSALKLARKLMIEDSLLNGRKSLVAIVSDGILPTTLDGDAAIDLLGTGKLVPRVLSAILVPEAAPLPELSQSALSTMAYRSRGSVSTQRYSEAEARGKLLLTELSQPAPLRALEVELDRGRWVGADLKGDVLSGGSVLGLGYYEGGTPKRVSVRGIRGGKRVWLTARRTSKSVAKNMALMTLAATQPDSFPGSDSAEESKRGFLRAASTQGVVTQVSAALALDAKDGFAADRLAMAQRWGSHNYRRVPPPAERKHKAWKRFADVLRLRGGHGGGRTGQLDGEVVSRRIKAHVIPVARGCYDRLLRRDQKAGGALRMRIEVARGEVHDAALPQMPASLEPIRECILDAIYAMPMPTVRQGDDPELVSVANYPLRFKLKEVGKGRVEQGEFTPTGEDSTFNPLTGLPD